MAIDTRTHDVTLSALSTAILPGDPGYDEARYGFNTAVEQHPAAIAYPETAADVAALVRGARAAGLHVAVQGGAHNAEPQGGARGRAADPHEQDGRRRRSTRSPGARASAPASSGRRSSTRPRRTASPRCTARRPTSASSATRSAAASAGSPGATACRRTASRRRSS